MSLLAAGCQGLIVSLQTKPTWPSRLCAFLLPSLSCPYMDIPRIAICCRRTQQCHGGVYTLFFSRFFYNTTLIQIANIYSKVPEVQEKTRFFSTCYGNNVAA